MFFDDILVYSPSWCMHLKHLERVLQLLQQNKLYAKFSKCSFGQQQVDYLGHTVSATGIAMDESKIKAVMAWPVPKNLKQLRGFLGLTGYYRRFIKHYATLAGPLTELLKKDSFHWSEATKKAFNTLKTALTQGPVLALPNFSIPFHLEIDASGMGIGAVLTQGKHPIAYFSKKMSPAMQRQSAYVRELYALTEAVAKFRHYLLGHKFILRTDQKSLRTLMDQNLQTPEQQRWIHKLLGYEFSIEYKPGKDNIPADALSRSFYAAWSQAVPTIVTQLQQAQSTDRDIQTLITEYVNNSGDQPNYSIHQGLLLWKNRIVILVGHELIQTILKEFHSSIIGGHAGVSRTLARITA